MNIDKVEGPLYRKDGRPLVTEHPITGEDMIDVVTDPAPVDESLIVCALRRERDPLEDAWMEPDEPGDDGF
jgi:hypothetical protein